jgi:hypothetical protein
VSPPALRKIAAADPRRRARCIKVQAVTVVERRVIPM